MPQPTAAMRSLHIPSSVTGGRVGSCQIDSVCACGHACVCVCVSMHVCGPGVVCRLSGEQAFVLRQPACFTVCACDFAFMQYICTQGCVHVTRGPTLYVISVVYTLPECNACAELSFLCTQRKWHVGWVDGACRDSVCRLRAQVSSAPTPSSAEPSKQLSLEWSGRASLRK